MAVDHDIGRTLSGMDQIEAALLQALCAGGVAVSQEHVQWGLAETLSAATAIRIEVRVGRLRTQAVWPMAWIQEAADGVGRPELQQTLGRMVRELASAQKSSIG